MLALRSAIWLCLAYAGSSSVISCKDDFGSDVDFAYAFKFPKSYDYAYMDASHKLAKSRHTLDSDSSAISATLSQLSDSGASYVLWNDQPPPSEDSKAPMAHAKGVLIFNADGGAWLTHSLPHFPSKVSEQKSGIWKDASPAFGQSFLCVTVDAEQIHKLAPVWAITRPVIYDSKMDYKEYFDLGMLLNKSWDESTMHTLAEITSRGGQTFSAFGKAGKWGKGKDLYHDLVGKKLGDLKMEGWRRGAGVWSAACAKPQVLDVTSVSFPGQSWETMNDHSKWAVTITGKPTLCVGDINRARGQDARGGGTVCLQDASLHEQLASVVNDTDTCGVNFFLV